MSLKGTLSVMGVKYKVYFLNSEELMEFQYKEFGEEGIRDIEKVVGPAGRFYGGLCDSARSRLFINSAMPKDKQLKVLFHEFMEAVDQETCIGLKHNQIEAISGSMFLSKLFENSIIGDWFKDEDEKTNNKPPKNGSRPSRAKGKRKSNDGAKQR